MFTRAGFNLRHKAVCTARVNGRVVHLIRFVPSNDYAWVGGDEVLWPEQANVSGVKLIHSGISSWNKESSPFPRRS